MEIKTLTPNSEFDLSLRDDLIVFFDGYARMLNSFFEFQDLGYSLFVLIKKLKSYDINTKNKFLNTILFALVDDLISWKEQVLISQTSEWIHYMDSSFYANISQMEVLLNGDDESEDSGFEFF